MAVRRGVVMVLSLTALLSAVGVVPADAAPLTARAVLARLATVPERGAAFVRSSFGPLDTDADGDGCRTTAEVLLAESRTRPRRAARCRVTTGRWVSWYDGARTASAAHLVVDPLVPLREAWESGARSWTPDARSRFANDIGYRWALGAVTPSSARARASRDPGRWLPTVDRCGYARHWIAVKYRWSLSVDRRERARLAAVLAGSCGRRTLALPARQAVFALDRPVQAPPAPATATPAAPPLPVPTPGAEPTPTPTATSTSPTEQQLPPTTTPASPSPSATPPTPTPTRTSATAVTVSGHVRRSDGTPVVAATVAAEDPVSGDVLKQSSTSSTGAWSFAVEPGLVRLVIDSAGADRASAGLPARFRWTGDLTVNEAVSLPVTLPDARPVTVMATDGQGAALGGALVTAPDWRATTAAALWPGGPVMTGSQQVAAQPVSTGADGRAVLHAFPSGDAGATYVEDNPSPGANQRAVLPALAVEATSLVVAIPSRPSCTPRAAVDIGQRPTTLVADLDRVRPRDSAQRAALLATADKIVAGTIPTVSYNADRSGDALRYLYDEGVALRRITGVLGYAYAVTHDPRYLHAMATAVALNAAAWPDWNPGHPLDAAQVATAVALAYRWSSSVMTAAERATVAAALTTKMVLAYSCADGALHRSRTATGNQNSVIATAATLAGLAVREDSSGWAAVGVADGTAALARFRLPDGTGRTVADGPTVEGLMYSTYEAASLALLQATRRSSAGDVPVRSALDGSLPDLGRLAAWSERCGTVVDAGIEDAWDLYPWVDRPTALAAMAASPEASGHVLDLIARLQARDTLTVPGAGTWDVADGIAELVLSGLSPGTTQPVAVQSYAPESGIIGCATHGSLRALVSGAPNDAPHAHRDIGNLVLSDGDQSVLADLGQRDYNYSALYVWRGLTKAHNVVGVLRDDGRVTQTDAGSGQVSATPDGLGMSSTNAMTGVSWTRSVALSPSTVTVRDKLRSTDPLATVKPLSTTFLLDVPPSRVADLGSGRLRFQLDDGKTWELQAPEGVTVGVTDAQPTAPYDDTAAYKLTLGPTHTLVQLRSSLVTDLELVTTLTRVSG